MPDGETGERRRWVWWQRTMLERHPAMEVDREAGLLELRQWDGSLLRRSELLRFKDDVDPGAVAFETGYAGAALDSWRIFERLRRDGVLADGRALPGLPADARCRARACTSAPARRTPTWRTTSAPCSTRCARSWRGVPAAALSIQWDICQEVLVYENYFPTRPPDYKERIVALLGRLGDAVPAGVELGYHLCYGSPADQHLVMPKDTAILTELANAIFARVQRPVDFLHLPVPRERDDAAYFLPLHSLRLPAPTRLYLGLIHHADEHGDRRRIATACTVTPRFGVATECGWGRTDPARVSSLLDSHRRGRGVADAVGAARLRAHGAGAPVFHHERGQRVGLGARLGDRAHRPQVGAQALRRHLDAHVPATRRIAEAHVRVVGQRSRRRPPACGGSAR